MCRCFGMASIWEAVRLWGVHEGKTITGGGRSWVRAKFGPPRDQLARATGGLLWGSVTPKLLLAPSGL